MSSLAFIVPCTHCLKMYDAMHAKWCDCIGDEQTLRCSHCGRCFCRAAPQYKTELWRMAPKDLHEQRRAHTTAPAGGFTDMTRPMVLVVDDSRIIRATTMRIVHSLGYGAMEAANAGEAEALTLLYQPEVVLTDALMPKTDGRELSRAIKSNALTRHTKVILMTGLYKAPHYKYEAFHSFGVDEYVLKPIEPEELRKLLERLVGLPARAIDFDIVA
jgi:CheY-like chemotaxis protein